MMDANSSGFLGEQWIAWKEHKETFWVMEMLSVLIEVMVTQVYAFVRSH